MMTTDTLVRKTDMRASHLLATTFLVQGCERALFDLRRSLGEAERSDDVRVGLLAANVLEEVLASWREAKLVLAGQGSEEAPELLLAVHSR